MALAIIQASSLSPTTIKSYCATLTAVGQLLSFNPSNINQFLRTLQDVEDSYESIKLKWSNPVTRAAILTAILAVLKLSRFKLEKKAHSQWRHIHWVLRRNSARKNGTLNAREAEAWVSFAEILSMRRSLEVHEPGSMRHLFLSWYTMWPPTRADHYNTLIFRREADVPANLRAWMYYRAPHLNNGTIRHKPAVDGVPHGGARTAILSSRDPVMPRVNFIVLQPSTPREWTSSLARPTYVGEWDKAPRMILMNHKTANTHGRIIRSLPNDLSHVLAASLKLFPRNVLFLSNASKQFSNSHSFTVWGERLLESLFNGRHLGFNGLRHSYISNVDMDKSSPQQLLTLARDMGHSAYQQKLYVRGTFKKGRSPVLKEN